MILTRRTNSTPSPYQGEGRGEGEDGSIGLINQAESTDDLSGPSI